MKNQEKRWNGREKSIREPEGELSQTLESYRARLEVAANLTADEARERFEKAIALKPTFLPARLACGELLAKRFAWKEVVDVVAPDGIVPSTDSRIAYLLGRADRGLDELETAQEQRHTARRRNVTNTHPQLDLAVNCVSTMNLVEACRKHNPGVRMLYTSTRQVYGKPKTLPVTEEHETVPIDVNGINKLAAEYYHLLYHETYGIRSTVLRLTNTSAGENFIELATVRLNQTPADDVQWVDKPTLKVTLQSELPPGLYDVWVINPGGQEGVLPRGLRVGRQVYLPALFNGYAP